MDRLPLDNLARIGKLTAETTSEDETRGLAAMLRVAREVAERVEELMAP